MDEAECSDGVGEVALDFLQGMRVGGCKRRVGAARDAENARVALQPSGGEGGTEAIAMAGDDDGFALGCCSLW